MCTTRFDASGPLGEHCLPDDGQWMGQVFLSRDGKYGLFLKGTSDVSDDRTIWASDVSGPTLGKPFRITGDFLPGTTLQDPQSHLLVYTWSPDSRHVAYVADALQDNLRDAFIVDIIDAPREPKRLNTNLPSPTSRVAELAFSPDGKWIAMLADMETAGVQEVFLVPLGDDGPGMPQKVSDPLTNTEEWTIAFAWSTDSSYFGFSGLDSASRITRASLVHLQNGQASAAMPLSASANDVRDLHFVSVGF